MPLKRGDRPLSWNEMNEATSSTIIGKTVTHPLLHIVKGLERCLEGGPEGQSRYRIRSTYWVCL